MKSLKGKAALITGGESGIGLATARRFVAEGARVHLVGIDETALRGAVEELGDDAADCSVADVTDEDAVEAAVRRTVERFGQLDVVFSNAGISGVVSPITDYPTDVFRRVMDVHVLGAFLILKHTLPYVAEGGSIIINSSVVGFTSDPGIAGYAAAKHAQLGLMRTAAKEAAARRIRVNTIHPGPTATPFQSAIETAATGLAPAEAAEVFDQMIPLGRHATPDEIAASVLYLACDESRFVSGTALRIDGGMSI